MVNKLMGAHDILCDQRTKLKNEFIYKMREGLARKASTNIWGEGFIFESADKNINDTFKKINTLNRLDNLFAYVERHCSLFGRAIITINPTKTGEFMLNISSPFWFTGIGKSFIQPQLAVIYQRVTVSQSNFIIKSEYTPKYVKHEIYSNHNETYVRVFDKEAEILKQFQLEPYYQHDLGFVPVVEFTNIPYYQQQWMDAEYIRITDWYPSSNFEELAYTTYKNFSKELRLCHSRIFFEDMPQQIINVFKNSNVIEDFEDQDAIFDTGNGKVMFQPGIADLTKYTAALDHIFDFYYKLAGSSRFSEGGGAQKTVAETSSIRSAMIESIKQKIRLRTEQCKELIRKLLCCYDAINDFWEDTEEFNFKIVGNITRDDSSWIDNKLKLISAGVISTIDFIQEMFNITTEQAKDKFEEVKKWNEENGLVNIFSEMPQENGSEESNFNKETGEHKDQAKQGTK